MKPSMAHNPKTAHMSAPVSMRNPDATAQALALLVLIMLVLASTYLYLNSAPDGAAMAQPAPIALEQK